MKKDNILFGGIMIIAAIAMIFSVRNDYYNHPIMTPLVVLGAIAMIICGIVFIIMGLTL